MKFKIAVTVITWIVLGWIDLYLTSIGTVVAGSAAGLQFEASNSAYVAAQSGMKLAASMHIALWFLVLATAAIWWKPFKQNKKRIAKWFASLTVIAIATFGVDARAYYDKTDYAEPYFIMPNETAFWVPDVGDNKSAQVKFGSQEYFEANKIAAKRFIIPHVKLENSGLFSNFYVPAGRLIIVDRTPYSREWVSAESRGSDKRNQSFPCQSKEGLNITVGMAIGVSIAEDNAARFLFRFGAEPPKGDRSKPEVVFQSVLNSRSLTAVMDTVGRNKVQALVCNEIGSRTFTQANLEATPMMTSVRDLADKYFASLGITLDYLGWANTMEFDQAVQKAVNDKFIADTIGPIMSVLTQNAENAVKESLGHGLAKGLPANLIAIPDSALNALIAGTKGK